MNAAIRQTGIALGTRPPRSWSMVTWASIAVLSVIASYLITVLLGLASFLFGVLLLLGMVAGPSLFGVIMAAFMLMIGGTVLWSLVPRKIPFEPNGVPVDLLREAHLRAEIQAVATVLNEKMPDEVYLVPIANAAVLERRNKRIMLLGVPILQLLTVSQFRAILAHEFGPTMRAIREWGLGCSVRA